MYRSILILFKRFFLGCLLPKNGSTGFKFWLFNLFGFESWVLVLSKTSLASVQAFFHAELDTKIFVETALSISSSLARLILSVLISLKHLHFWILLSCLESRAFWLILSSATAQSKRPVRNFVLSCLFGHRKSTKCSFVDASRICVPWKSLSLVLLSNYYRDWSSFQRFFWDEPVGWAGLKILLLLVWI